jgi:hypothetical protein
MTASPFQTLALVQLVPDGEWFVAIPAHNPLGDPSQWAVDVYKDLSFAALKTTAELTVIEDVPPLNRFIPVNLELIPDMMEASSFSLLGGLVFATLANHAEEETTPQNKLISLTLARLSQALGHGLYVALAVMPEREETLYAAHDFLVHSAQAKLHAAGVSPETALDDDATDESGDDATGSSADETLPAEETP